MLVDACDGKVLGQGAGEGGLERERVWYYDRNGDGKVDRELHHYIDTSDADWELLDDDYNGRYERKIHYGFTGTETPVDIPVPEGVHVQRNP